MHCCIAFWNFWAPAFEFQHYLRFLRILYDTEQKRWVRKADLFLSVFGAHQQICSVLETGIEPIQIHVTWHKHNFSHNRNKQQNFKNTSEIFQYTHWVIMKWKLKKDSFLSWGHQTSNSAAGTRILDYRSMLLANACLEFWEMSNFVFVSCPLSVRFGLWWNESFF